MRSLEWRQTPHGEWLCDAVGLVARNAEHRWYSYPFGAQTRLGPFDDLALAQQALVELTEEEDQP